MRPLNTAVRASHLFTLFHISTSFLFILKQISARSLYLLEVTLVQQNCPQPFCAGSRRHLQRPPSRGAGSSRRDPCHTCTVTRHVEVPFSGPSFYTSNIGICILPHYWLQLYLLLPARVPMLFFLASLSGKDFCAEQYLHLGKPLLVYILLIRT